MRTTISRLVNLTAAAGLAAALILPAAGPVAAAEESRILRVGTIQDLDSMNPWMTAYTTGFEVFILNYDLLVGFGKDLEPVPGYAESWERTDNGDGTFTWTFKLRDGMLWSDGEPATSEDEVKAFVKQYVHANYLGTVRPLSMAALELLSEKHYTFPLEAGYKKLLTMSSAGKAATP